MRPEIDLRGEGDSLEVAHSLIPVQVNGVGDLEWTPGLVLETGPGLVQREPAVSSVGPAAGSAQTSAASPSQTPPQGERASIAGPNAVFTRYRRLAILLDALAAVAGAAIGVWARFGSNPAMHYLVYAALVPLAWVAIVSTRRGYETRFLGAGPEEFRRIADAGLMLFILIAISSFTLKGEIARGYVVIAVPATVMLALLGRRALRSWLGRLRRHGSGVHRVVVVGQAGPVAAMIQELERVPENGLLPVGACVAGSQASPAVFAEGFDSVHDVPLLGGLGSVLEAVELTGANVVAVASCAELTGVALRRLAWALEDRDVELVVSPGIIEVAGPRLSIRPVAGLSLLHLERPSLSGGRWLMKSVFDRLGGSLLLALAAPVLLLTALAVRLDSRGPVFFTQRRVGLGGKEFTMVKFRSMVADAEDILPALADHDEGAGVLFKVRADPRVTRVGSVIRRFSLDELPQLFNVVLGEMSLVGPRPPLPGEVAQYGSDVVRRLRVRPGLTGLWQVNGRSDLSWEESVRLDLRYVDNWSLMMDLQILWRTIRAVLMGRGAY